MWARSWARAALGAALGLAWVSTTGHAQAQQQQPPPPALGWQARFERERPAVLRAIDGVPGPAGYERETHYDKRRLIFGGALLLGAEALQALTVSSQGIEAVELVPCAGIFWGDYSTSGANDSSQGFYAKTMLRTFMSLPLCAAFLVGGVELVRGLADPRPVWVRKAARAGSFRVHASLTLTDQEARIHAVGHF